MGNRRDNVFIVLSAAAAAACLAGALLIRSMNSGLVGVFQGEGWGAQSPLIVAAMVKGLTHGGVILGFVAVIGFLGLKRKVFRRHSILLRILLCGVLAADLAWVSSRYVKGYNSDAVYRSNILIETLQSDPEPFRLKLLTRGGLYDYWLGTVFPYYGIQRLDLVAAARLPELELKFFGAFNDNPERLWQLANVRYLFGDVRAASSMLRDPARAGAFEPVLAFNVARDGEGLAIVPAQKGQSPAHVLLRYKNALPRAALFHSWRTVGTDDEGLQILADKALDPHAAVLVSTGEPGVDIPAAPQDGGGGAARRSRWYRTRPLPFRCGCRRSSNPRSCC